MLPPSWRWTQSPIAAAYDRTPLHAQYQWHRTAISIYAERAELKVRALPDEETRELRAMRVRRDDLLDMIVALIVLTSRALHAARWQNQSISRIQRHRS